ncbi:MAG: glycosyltransferase [Nitrospiria bacterium]
MSSPRILFQTHNRRGLGHLMRGVNIATELKALAPAADILFYSKNPSARRVCGERFNTFIETDESGLSHWPELVASFDPDVIIYDTVLPKAGEAVSVPEQTRQVYIMRKSKPERHEEIMRHPLIQDVDRIIIPHTADEFNYVLPPETGKKAVLVGPIVRLPGKRIEAALREKYGIAPSDFLLTSTVGGGGFQAQADHFFQVVFEIHRQIATSLAGLRHLVIEGPHYQKTLEALKGMRIIKAEPEMVSLLATSDLVIAEGGYNTVSEIRLVKTPAVFLPSARNYDDQKERVDVLEAKGLARVFSKGDPKNIAEQVKKIVTDKNALQTMRENYVRDHMPWGNQRAAELILAETV